MATKPRLSRETGGTKTDVSAVLVPSMLPTGAFDPLAPDLPIRVPIGHHPLPTPVMVRVVEPVSVSEKRFFMSIAIRRRRAVMPLPLLPAVMAIGVGEGGR